MENPILKSKNINKILTKNENKEIYQLINTSNISAQNEDCNNVLQLAIKKENIKLIRFLLKFINKNNFTILNKSLINSLTKINDKIVRKELLKYFKLTDNDCRQLNNAILNNNVEFVKNYFLNKSFLIDLKITNSMTALHIASRYKTQSKKSDEGKYLRDKNGIFIEDEDQRKLNDEIVKFLIECEPDVNVIDYKGRTPLHFASLFCNYNTVDILLKHGADITIIDQYENSVLDITAHQLSSKSLNILQLLLDHNKSLIDNKSDNAIDIQSGKLIYSATRNSYGKVKCLIEHGANPGIINNDELTMIHAAIRQSNYKLIEYMLKNNINFNVIDKYGNTPLHEASNHDWERILEMIIKSDSNINQELITAKNNNGETILHVAAKRLTPKPVKYILKLGVLNINEIDDKGNTALHLAQTSNSTLRVNEIVSMLLKSGSDVNLKNKEGKTVLHLACDKCSVKIVKMLINSKSEINTIDNKGNTPLHYAAKSASDKIEILLEHGANPKIRNNYGNTPILLAASCFTIFYFPLKDPYEEDTMDTNAYKKVDMLIAHGSDLNEKDNNGNTLLHLASLNTNVKLIKRLIKDGLDVNAVNNEGNTALHISLQNSKERNIICLLENGADTTIKNNDGLTIFDITTSEECKALLTPKKQ